LPDRGSNPIRRGGKTEANRLSYGAASCCMQANETRPDEFD
jgi:hypothetical protein